MLNHIVIMGRLTRDPEIKNVNGQTVAEFTVANERDYQKAGAERETDFIDCRAWCQLGDFVGKYFQKGSMIVIAGRLQSRKWTEADGTKRKAWFVNSQAVWFGERKKDSSGEKPYSTYTRSAGNRPPDIRADDFDEDGDFPF